MLFNSVNFVFFLPLVFGLFFLLPQKARTPFFLLSSYFFYGCWKIEFLPLIMFSTLVDYFCGLYMNKYDGRNRKYLLAISLVSNLGLLFIFKYLFFFNSSLNNVFSFLDFDIQITEFKLLLPVGISFYTFQTLSYTLDVYKGKVKPERNLLQFALFVSYWPQLVAGPIERSERLLPQLKKKVSFDFENLSTGLLRIGIGLFKKVVIADRASVFANLVFNDLESYSGAQIILGTFMFTIQIYCDFSGYSDIAIGSARLFGVDLMENFRAPYFASSFSDFWKRWHVSLSSWFRDYIYIPLGGNRKRKRVFFNIMATFLISGLWHGANWTFVIWGGVHGVFLILERLIKRLNISRYVPQLIKIIITFLLINLTWVLFRLNHVSDLFPYFKSLSKFEIAQIGWYIFGDYKDELMIMIWNIALLILLDIFFVRLLNNYKKFLWMKFLVILTLLLSISFFGVFHNQAEFIYFQF